MLCDKRLGLLKSTINSEGQTAPVAPSSSLIFLRIVRRSSAWTTSWDSHHQRTLKGFTSLLFGKSVSLLHSHIFGNPRCNVISFITLRIIEMTRLYHSSRVPRFTVLVFLRTFSFSNWILLGLLVGFTASPHEKEIPHGCTFYNRNILKPSQHRAVYEIA